MYASEYLEACYGMFSEMSNNPQVSEIIFPPGHINLSPGHGIKVPSQGGSAKTSIPFNMDLALEMQSYAVAHRNDKGGYKMCIIPDTIIDRVGNELKRFLCAVQAYLDSYEHPQMELDELLQSLVDPEYPKYLKKLKKASWIASGELELIEPNPELEIDGIRYITDIGEIFNPAYCFRWELQAEDDYLNGNLPIEVIPDDSINTFKRALAALLPVDIGIVEEDEVLFELTGSSTYSDVKGERVYEAKGRGLNTFSSAPLHGKRSTIYKSPADQRDAVIFPVPQSNSVKLIEKQVHRVVEAIAYSLHIRDPYEFDKKLDDFRKKNKFFLDRDIKKEGITKPRQLVIAALEVLKANFPYCPAWKYMNIYSNYYLDLEDGSTYNPARGHGLGMANSLTTLIQCALFSIARTRALLSVGGDESNMDFDAIFLNDDCSIGAETADELELIDEYDDAVLTEYQIIKNKKKSTKGRSTVFCEQYFTHLPRDRYNRQSLPAGRVGKKSYLLNEIYRLFAETNIVSAKWSANNIAKTINYNDIVNVRQELVAFWGYEFYPNEANYPYVFGGWFTPGMLGVRLDLFYLGTPGMEQLKALTAVVGSKELHKPIRGGKNKPYTDPIQQKLGRGLELPDDSRINYKKDLHEIKELFFKWNDKPSQERAWEETYQIRRGLFNKDWPKPPEDITGTIIRLLLSSYPRRDFLPHPDRCTRRPLNREDLPVRKPYRSPTPMLSYIKYYNPEQVGSRIVPERKSWDNMGINRKMTAQERAAAFRNTELIPGNSPMVSDPRDYGFILPEGSLRQWNNPGAVVSVWSQFTSEESIPEPHDKAYERDLWDDKEIELLDLLTSELGRNVSLFLGKIRWPGIDALKRVAILLPEALVDYDWPAPEEEPEVEIIDEADSEPEETDSESDEEEDPVPPQPEIAEGSELLGIEDYWTWKNDRSLPVKNELTLTTYREIEAIEIQYYALRNRNDIEEANKATDISGRDSAQFISIVWKASGGEILDNKLVLIQDDPGGGSDSDSSGVFDLW
jgi:hypothetical protein